MYNRYIPQPDGSHRRKQMQEPPRKSPCPPRQEPSPPPCPPPEPPPCRPQHQEPPHRPPCKTQDPSIHGFLRQLLPKDFDTGDLIVILLLLLMAGDSAEDRNNAILTLALYFLM